MQIHAILDMESTHGPQISQKPNLLCLYLCLAGCVLAVPGDPDAVEDLSALEHHPLHVVQDGDFRPRAVPRQPVETT